MNFLASNHTVEDIFGKIPAPSPVAALGEGGVGIGRFLSNLIELIFTAAGIVFIFMLLWGAFQWLISGGEKEKLAQAQQRIIHAIIGLVLIAISFAIISIIGTFTGFKLFEPRLQLDPRFNPEYNCETNTYACPTGWSCVGGVGDDGRGCKKPR